MDSKKLTAQLVANKDAEKAEQMSAYMRNQFPFLGIATPMRGGADKILDSK